MDARLHKLAVTRIVAVELIIDDKPLLVFHQRELVAEFNFRSRFAADKHLNVPIVEAGDFVLVLDQPSPDDAFVRLGVTLDPVGQLLHIPQDGLADARP